ncbi:hypothetical protein [Aureivirga marina]|uniref:hypothetical protein n=1 Tax=Aureivirga marina TaxID=1182451 RepID=UPI0018CAA514|nr:hypothetical protein [Aureivirga marina]
MLKKYILISFFTFPLFFACEVNPLKQAEEEATKSSKEFFHWYSKNKKELLEKRKAIVFVDDDGFYAVNMFKIDEYVAFLNESGKFSDDFIQKEKDYWLGECLDIVFKTQKEGTKSETIAFPCQFEENPFYFSSENLTDNHINNLIMKTDSISLETAILNYENHNLKLHNKDGKWKVMDWATN